MTIAESATLLIDLFGMVGTVGAALAAGYSMNIAANTLIEQKENNKRALKPFIVIEGKDYSLEYKEDEPFFMLNWDSGTFDLSDGSMKVGSYINILNISNGIAKNIKINFEIENAYSFIKKMQLENNDKNLKVYINKHYSGKGKVDAIFFEYFLKTETEVKNYGAHPYVFEELQEQQYLVMTPSKDGSSYKIKIPSAYLAMYNLFFHLRVFSKVDKKDLPKLKIIINCQDITDEDYTFTYYFKPESYSRKSSIYENTKARIIFGISECK